MRDKYLILKITLIAAGYLLVSYFDSPEYYSFKQEVKHVKLHVGDSSSCYLDCHRHYVSSNTRR